MYWLDHEGLRFMQTLTHTETKKCTTSAGLFEVLNGKVRLPHNEPILSLQYCKLTREQNENTEKGWIDKGSKPMNVFTKKR